MIYLSFMSIFFVYILLLSGCTPRGVDKGPLTA